jgi:hypothetical protein
MEAAQHLIEQFRRSEPYSLLSEPSDTPGRIAYRLRIARPIPIAVSTTVGDAFHNMRSALESLAFAPSAAGMIIGSGAASRNALNGALWMPPFQMRHGLRLHDLVHCVQPAAVDRDRDRDRQQVITRRVDVLGGVADTAGAIPVGIGSGVGVRRVRLNRRRPSRRRGVAAAPPLIVAPYSCRKSTAPG